MGADQTKSAQLQIRVSPAQKRRLKQLAREAAMDVSSWVLRRVLPDEAERFQELVAALERLPDRFRWAELADYLRELPPALFARAIASAPRARLGPETMNRLAGTLELAAFRRDQSSPYWTDQVAIPQEPVFGSALSSVRLHLLVRAPVALRRRNLFMDASMDDRV